MGASAERFLGEGGNDTLNGSGGADTLDGGDGNDIFVLNAAASGSFTLLDSSGVDTIPSTIARDLRSYASLENAVLQGGANASLVGNGQENGLLGNGGNNTLAGLGGNDALNGNGGNDDLFGQGGLDT